MSPQSLCPFKLTLMVKIESIVSISGINLARSPFHEKFSLCKLFVDLEMIIVMSALNESIGRLCANHPDLQAESKLQIYDLD